MPPGREPARTGSSGWEPEASVLSPSPLGTGAISLPPTGEPQAEAHRIARQVAAHPVMKAGGSAEMSLAPEELGHLRLNVEASNAGLRIVIEAARPETADLMRRHVEALRQELRQEGLGAVSVSIGGGEGRRGGSRLRTADRGEAGPPRRHGPRGRNPVPLRSPIRLPCPGPPVRRATSTCASRRLPWIPHHLPLRRVPPFPPPLLRPRPRPRTP